MSNHPSRSGAISAQLFAEFVETLQQTTDEEAPDAISFHKLRHHILRAALRVAVKRAARKFHWPSEFKPSLGISPGGAIFKNRLGSQDSLPDVQRAWIEFEVQKAAKSAMAALENTP